MFFGKIKVNIMNKEQLRLLKLKNKAFKRHKDSVDTAEQLWKEDIEDANMRFKEIVEYSHDRLKEKMNEINKGEYWEQMRLDLRNEKIEDDALIEEFDRQEEDETILDAMMKGVVNNED